MLVFMVVVGTIGAVMLLTALIDRAPLAPPAVPEWVGALPAQRDGVLPAQRDGATADAVEPEAGGVR
jgi:hypothetical protein